MIPSDPEKARASGAAWLLDGERKAAACDCLAPARRLRAHAREAGPGAAWDGETLVAGHLALTAAAADKSLDWLLHPLRELPWNIRGAETGAHEEKASLRPASLRQAARASALAAAAPSAPPPGPGMARTPGEKSAPRRAQPDYGSTLPQASGVQAMQRSVFVPGTAATRLPAPGPAAEKRPQAGASARKPRPGPARDADASPSLFKSQNEVEKRLREMAEENPVAARLKRPLPPASDRLEAGAWFCAWIQEGLSPSEKERAAPAGSEAAAPQAGPRGAAPRPVENGPVDPRSPQAPPPLRPQWTQTLDAILSEPGKTLSSFPSSSLPPSTYVRAPSAVPDSALTVRAVRPESAPSPEKPETPAPRAAPGFAWLEEDEDLAGRLHRLLRRQARRRGVDL